MQKSCIESYLEKWFSFPKNKLYCQVATYSKGRSRIRTMDLYHLTEDAHLIFLTHTSSKKWLDLSHCQSISICMLNLEQGQITVEGEASLKTSLIDLPLMHYYWDHFLDQYWRDYYLSSST